ncbi:MAG: hypothetical protein ACRD43_11300 [Pyrinomonadaceae bacterium]
MDRLRMENDQLKRENECLRRQTYGRHGDAYSKDVWTVAPVPPPAVDAPAPPPVVRFHHSSDR